jgi:D-lactate dehydrogenase
MAGVGCKLLFHDVEKREDLVKELGAQYVDLLELLGRSDVVSLHCPLNDKTKYILNQETLELMKDGSFLLNTGRGGLIETQALIENLKKNKFRGVGLDVYEYEEGVFFKDHSSLGISDESLLRLMSFPNVLITSHQAFFTEEALENIAKISLENIAAYINKSPTLSTLIPSRPFKLSL